MLNSDSESESQNSGLRFMRKLRSEQFAEQMALLWPEGVSNAITGRSRTSTSSPFAYNSLIIVTYLGKYSPLVTIEALPDEILLYVFDFCKLKQASMNNSAFWPGKWPGEWPGLWPRIWHTLVHVCQRWRYIVFSSPLRLDLRLYCSDRISMKEMLNVWPPFPIEIRSSTDNIGDNIVVALEHHDRICDIILRLACSECVSLATVMQKRFPLLTSLQLHLSSPWHHHIPVLPDTFLGGFAPRLRSVCLDGLPFPTLPQLLLSCNDLSELRLHCIPEVGYISPEAMVTGLSSLTRLTLLCIEFGRFEKIRVRGPPPVTRALFPVLTELELFGVSEYLEDLLARIDAPQLEIITIRFVGNHVDIQRVMSHLLRLMDGPFERADVRFSFDDIEIKLDRPKGTAPPKKLKLGFIEEDIGQQVLTMTQLSTQSLSLLSNITELEIGSNENFDELDDLELDNLIDNPGWLVLFHTSTALRTLRLWGEIQPFVIISLRGLGHIGESVPEVLPGLQNLYLYQWYWQNEPEQVLEEFIAARQRSDHPVTVHHMPYHSHYDSDLEY
jgi:hypothetical protein